LIDSNWTSYSGRLGQVLPEPATGEIDTRGGAYDTHGEGGHDAEPGPEPPSSSATNRSADETYDFAQIVPALLS
jgi:hypothetical protein